MKKRYIVNRALYGSIAREILITKNKPGDRKCWPDKNGDRD